MLKALFDLEPVRSELVVIPYGCHLISAPIISPLRRPAPGESTACAIYSSEDRELLDGCRCLVEWNKISEPRMKMITAPVLIKQAGARPPISPQRSDGDVVHALT
jgi:hypothetical protein